MVERIPIPARLVPKDAHVEINAKVFAGYNGGSVYVVTEDKLSEIKGREAGEYDVENGNVAS